MATKYNIVINEDQRIMLAHALSAMLDKYRNLPFEGRDDAADLRLMLVSLVVDECEDPGAQHDFTM